MMGLPPSKPFSGAPLAGEWVTIFTTRIDDDDVAVDALISVQVEGVDGLKRWFNCQSGYYVYLEDEGVRWIRGHYAEATSSFEAQALIAAASLAFK